MGGFRQHHAAGRRQTLQSGGDVDAVAVDRAVLGLADVAEVYADAEMHLAVVLQRRVGGREFGLGVDRGFHRAGGAVEDREHRVAGHIDDAAAVGLDVGAEYRAVVGQRGDGGGLVVAHQPRITSDVGRENRGEPLSDVALSHDAHPPDRLK